MGCATENVGHGDQFGTTNARHGAKAAGLPSRRPLNRTCWLTHQSPLMGHLFDSPVALALGEHHQPKNRAQVEQLFLYSLLVQHVIFSHQYPAKGRDRNLVSNVTVPPPEWGG